MQERDLSWFVWACVSVCVCVHVNKYAMKSDLLSFRNTTEHFVLISIKMTNNFILVVDEFHEG